MKTTIIAVCTVAAALVACADKPQPRAPSTTTGTTTTTSYEQPAAMPAPPLESTGTSSSFGEGTPNAMDGAMSSDDHPIVHPAPMLAPPIDRSLEPAQPAAPQAAKSVAEQGNSKAELKTTAHIRKTMMVSKSLSFGAKNVKVITVGSVVTLKGTVKTDAEKSEIAGIARDTEGVTAVDDQLIVKQ